MSRSVITAAVRILLKHLPLLRAIPEVEVVDLALAEQVPPMLRSGLHDKVTADGYLARCFFCWRPWHAKLHYQCCPARFAGHRAHDLWLIGLDLVFCWACGAYTRTRTARLQQSCPQQTSQMTLVRRLRLGCEPIAGIFVARPAPIVPDYWFVIDAAG